MSNRAIDLRSRGLSIWSQQTLICDYKSQEVAIGSYVIVRPVVQRRTINHAWSWADKSRDWICDHAIGRAIRGTVSSLVVQSITISDD